MITNTRKQKLKISFERQWAAFLDAWCPLPAFRSCFVEFTRCLNVLLMNLWGRKWSPCPIPPPSQNKFPRKFTVFLWWDFASPILLDVLSLVDVCTFKKTVICTRIYIMISVTFFSLILYFWKSNLYSRFLIFAFWYLLSILYL